MFFLFFFFPLPPPPTPHLPSPQTLEGKTNKTNKSKFHTSCSTVFSSNGHTPIGPRFVYPCTNEQIMNEQGWKWSLIESEPSVLLLFFIFFFFCSGFWQPQPRCSEFPTGKLSVPPTSHFFFSLHIYLFFSQADGFAPTVVQFNIYMFPSVWFPPQREVGIPASDLPQRWSGPSF